MSDTNEKTPQSRPDAAKASKPVNGGDATASGPIATKPATSKANQTAAVPKQAAPGMKQSLAKPSASAAKPSKASAKPVAARSGANPPGEAQAALPVQAASASSNASLPTAAAKKSPAAKKASAKPTGQKTKPVPKAAAKPTEHKPDISSVAQAVPKVSAQVNAESQVPAVKIKASAAQAAAGSIPAAQAAAVVSLTAEQPAETAKLPAYNDQQTTESALSPTHAVTDSASSRETPAGQKAGIEPAPDSIAKPKTPGRFQQQLPHYLRLMRLDKPIGTLLLLWPTLWALWLAAKGVPSLKNLVIFSLGTLVMRSAGCVINDFADRKIDGRVERTRGRPLATGAVTSREAIGLFIGLCLVAFGLVLCTDWLTIKLSFGGLALAFCYPFMKRHTHLPQVVLGAAFAWGIPMAYAAETGKLDKNMWLIYLAVVLWTVVYDTFYAMVDRDDDIKIGVKSTAILFGEQDRIITGTLQLMVLYALHLVGKAYSLGAWYYLGLVIAAGLFAYQQWLIRKREKQPCFKAFLNNNWVGAAVFIGIAVDLASK